MLLRTVECQAVRNAPAAAPLHPWVWPSSPWQRVHIDFAGPFQGRTFFVLVDAHSKWPEVVQMTSTSATFVLRLSMYCGTCLQHMVCLGKLSQTTVRSLDPRNFQTS